MSSRTFPGGASVEARPIVWRSAVEPSATLARSSENSQGAGAEMQARIQDAYERGLQEGLAGAETAAAQRASAQLAPVLSNLGAVIRELAGVRKLFRMEAEEATVNLAVGISRRVLQREISMDPEAILGLVRSAFDRVNARELHRLRIAPGEAAVIQQNRATLGLPSGVEIAADASLPPGSAIFETSRGELDASAATQLDEIQRGFTDLVHRRKS
ncbi:MAG: FliH/SctL family protein [Bryobacteraceae bacterium]